MKFLISKFQIINIELQRVFDHGWRKIFGLPTLRRSKITPNLFLGGQYSFVGIAHLEKMGVTAIVNMRMHSVYDNQLKEAEVKYLQLPTVDQAAPSLEHLLLGIDFIKKEIDSGGKVYVHCKHGEGRGPSMAIAYLMSTGLTLDDAINQVKKVRVFIRLTNVQINRLKELETILNQSKSSQIVA